MLLDYELHLCISVPSITPLGGTRWLVGLMLYISLPPGCLGSGRIISLEVTECSGILHHGSIFPSLAKSVRVFFSDIHRDNLVELWYLKLMKVWNPPDDWLPWSFFL